MIIPPSHLSFARSYLPQIKYEDFPKFLKYLKNKEVKSERGNILPGSLKPSQSDKEYNSEKLVDMGKITQPLIISADNYIMDGHHRWVNRLNFAPKDTVPVIQIDLPILELIAAAKSFGSVSYKDVTESVVVGWGRFSIPTIGHAQLINKVVSLAESRGSEARIYTSGSFNSKNPLPPITKLNYLHKLFPGVSISESTGLIPLLKSLSEEFDELVLVAGSDRIQEYRSKIDRYNIHPLDISFDPEKNFWFESIALVSAGERNSQSSGIDGISGTKMRQFIREDNFSYFFENLPTKNLMLAREIYNSARRNLVEDKEVVKVKKKSLENLKNKYKKTEDITYNVINSDAYDNTVSGLGRAVSLKMQENKKKEE